MLKFIHDMIFVFKAGLHLLILHAIMEGNALTLALPLVPDFSYQSALVAVCGAESIEVRSCNFSLISFSSCWRHSSMNADLPISDFDSTQ